MNHIYGYPHSKEAEFYKLLLDYDESLERDLADCRAIWYESGTQNLMVGDYGMSDRIEAIVISKKFGFIERLVKNDKIKDNGIKPRTDLVKEIQIVDYKTGKALGWKNQYSETEQLIMYLSIQDNPLGYLCKIIKE